MNGFYGAYIRAGTAIGTDFGIYLINVTGRYSFNGTFVNTGTTCGTIFRNYMSHLKEFWLSKQK